MIWINRFLILFLLWVLTFSLKAQDASFSQFYANPMYLNPALAGNTECGRLNLNFRNQWPSLNKAYVTYSIAYDQNLATINSGFGFMVVRDQQANGAYNRTLAAGIYSYKLQIAAQSVVHFGVKAAFYQESIDWNNLVFADMINSSTGVADLQTMETSPSEPTIYTADFAAGLAYGYSDKFFVGVGADHLSQPQMSFYDDNAEQLHLRYTAHAGLNFNASAGSLGEVQQGDLLIQPNLLFLQQHNFSQVNMGVYIGKAPFVTGLWYRHTPNNADAVAVLLGLQWNNYRIGYSYDYTVSKLSGKSGGAHEISFGWDFCVYTYPKRSIRTIKSPSF